MGGYGYSLELHNYFMNSCLVEKGMFARIYILLRNLEVVYLAYIVSTFLDILKDLFLMEIGSLSQLVIMFTKIYFHELTVT